MNFLLTSARPAFGALVAASVLSACGGGGGDGPRVSAGAQRITFAAAPALQAGASASVNATASSGLPVSYASTTAAVCSVDAGTGMVSGTSIGSCSITASQGGNSQFAPASPATLTFPVSGRVQTLSFMPAPEVAVGGTATVQASATSGAAVRYSSLSAAACSVDAASGDVLGLAAGTCLVAADQPGDSQWAPAVQATLNLTVNRRAQAITFAALPAVAVGSSVTAQGSASSGLPVAFSSLTPDVCGVGATTGVVTGVAAGTCSIAADQPGDAAWAAAARVLQATAVVRSTQSLTFVSVPAGVTVGSTATVRATASSGLAVRYSSLSAANCAVDAGSGTVTGLSIGSCTVAADQPGNTAWVPAVQITQSFPVAGQAQTITFSAAPQLTAGGTATVQASASSGLVVSYTSLTPNVCGVHAASGFVTSLVAGACTIAANQAGNTAWLPAAQAVQTLGVALAPQTLSFTAAPSAVAVGSTVTVRATASSGLAVSYSSLTSSTCSVGAGSGVVTGVASGSCTIAANQAGDATWATAPQLTLAINVNGMAQTIAFSAAPALTVGGTATVRAAASSGLAVVYSSLTAAVCTVNAGSGVVSGLAAGTCRIAADQAGNASWAAATQVTQALTVAPNPVQTISFAAAPILTLGGSATVRATASSGLPVSYGTVTGTVCAVNASSGVVSSLTLGDCVITADQAGNATYNPAPQVMQTLPVQIPAGVTAPGVPQGVAAKLGSNTSTVVVSVTSVNSGGSPVTGYTVVSQPAGISVNAATAPVTVTCPSGCAGYAFSIRASNQVGQGAASAAVDVLTTFDVITTFREPDTQPRDTIFTGSFVHNATTGAITSLTGQLTESMTGNAVGNAPYFDMTQVPLTYQLNTRADATLGGTFVAAFAKNTLTTFTTIAGGDGWSPAAGVANGGIYAGFPAAYAGSTQNSYVLIFVPNNPFAALTQAQIDKLAYADCAPGGMMGAVCMTGTSVAGYGSSGTMSGYPISQVITRR